MDVAGDPFLLFSSTDGFKVVLGLGGGLRASRSLSHATFFKRFKKKLYVLDFFCRCLNVFELLLTKDKLEDMDVSLNFPTRRKGP